MNLLKIDVTPVYEANRKAYYENWPVICNEGGSRSSKSYSIIQLLVEIAQNTKNTRISIVSHSLPHIKRGAYRDFRSIMEACNLWNDDDFSYSDYIYTFKSGSYIELFGLEDEGKARGPGRDILFVNEANLIKKTLYDQLAMRTTGQIFLDWNPADFVNWVYDVADNPKNKTIRSTYLNNRANLSQSQINAIEAFKDLPDDFMWKVYGLGLRGAAKEIIYTQWKVCAELPGKGDVFYGLDFGYNHPAALVRIEHYEGTNYVEECIYQSNLTLSDLIVKIKQHVAGKAPIYADAAEPKSIEEIFRAGLNIKAASKDVWAGILKVKSFPLVVTDRSENLKKELSSYKWKKDKNDNIIEEPVKLNDDACFVYSTPIQTIDGVKPIGEICEKDFVLTSFGFQRVIHKHDNGMKKVCKYVLHFDTFCVALICTPNHLIKTNSGWTEISKLQSMQTVSLLKHLMGEDSLFIPANDISQTAHSTCIGMYGKQSSESEKGGIISTILTKIHGTIGLKTLRRLKQKNIYQTTQKIKVRKKWQNFSQLELPPLLNGTKAKKVKNGIESMPSNQGLVSRWLSKKLARFAKKDSLQKQSMQNFAIQTARLKHLECVTSWQENVYDLTIENNHEYFANCVLVHNCDAMRYGIYSHFDKTKYRVLVG